MNIHARVIREYLTIRVAGKELFDSHKMSIRFTPTGVWLWKFQDRRSKCCSGPLHFVKAFDASLQCRIRVVSC